jgi:DNA-binding NtrC family response regulator
MYSDPRTTLPPPLREPSHVEIVRCSLKVTQGPDGGKLLDPLTESTIIGRDPWCDLVMLDPRCSRQHCEVMADSEGVRVRDLGASNGVWVNGMRVVEAYLSPTDVFHIGDSAIRLNAEQGLRRVERTVLDPTGALIGQGPKMQRMFGLMVKAAPDDFPVILYGEPGTGRTTVCRAIFELGRRNLGPFVIVDCGASDWQSLERKLFGVMAGATTDELERKPGAFERAQGGALLLQNVDETSMFVQHRILEVLDHGRVRPVGSPTGFDLDSRLFVTAHRSLGQDVVEGRFSSHLYDQINECELQLPPLRDRLEDLPALATHFLKAHTEGRDSDPKTPASFAVDALRRLQNHSWPGNVCELGLVIGRAVDRTQGALIPAEAIELGSWGPGSAPAAEEPTEAW